jgi:predicted NBD/HSP70 family sugar kinase
MPQSAKHSLKPADAAVVLDLVRSGRAASRAELARITGLSPSTIAQRADELLATGLIRETSAAAGRPGRRPRTLEVNSEGSVVCAADLGSHHATFGVFDLSGRMLGATSEPMDITAGPDRVLRWVATVSRDVAADHAAGWAIRGYGLGMPGPVDAVTHAMVSPSRMPGWNGIDAASALAELTGLPVAVDNDANLMALGERTLRGQDDENFVFVKAGASIGCGVIAYGDVYRGHHGMAGDISHVTVPDAPAVLCSCGRTGCLDAVAGGAAIVRALQAVNVQVEGTQDVVALARDAHPLATQMLREAGLRIGRVLATIMNFYNPGSLILGGILSDAESFVAGVRSAIYSNCLPMITDQLDVATTRAKQHAGILGGARLILDQLFSPDRLDELLGATP